MGTITDFVLTVAGSPWAYVILATLLIIDGFFPFVPGESVVVALAVLAAANHGPDLWLVLIIAIIASTIGDAIAFRVGRRVGVRRWAWMRRRRVARAFEWAARGYDRRPAMLMLTAKFIPVARVAVTMTAGATGFPVRRYLPLALTASTIYTAYHVALGVLAGTWLASNPLLAIVAAMVGVMLLGLLIDLGLKMLASARLRRTACQTEVNAEAAREALG